MKKRINAGVLSMETMEGRKGFEKPSLTKNEAFYAYESYKDANTSHIFRKTRLVKLDKNLPRELDPTSGLPSFLQKTRPSSSADPLKRQWSQMTLKEQRNYLRNQKRRLVTSESRAVTEANGQRIKHVHI